MRKKVASTEPAGMSDQLRHKYVHFIIIQVHVYQILFILRGFW